MLSTNLKRLRKAAGLSQSEVARRAQIDQAYMVLLENGSRRNPSLKILTQIARAIGVPLTALVGEGEKQR